MLVTWRYRDRNSILQRFDTRAWIIFYLCFLFSVLQFWDLRYLAFFFVIAIISLILSRIQLKEMYRALIFIGGFITVFAFLTFLTGRGGMEVYTEEHIITTISAPFSIFGWVPTLTITVERIFFAISQFFRVFSIAIMTIIIPYSMNPALYGVTFRGLGLPDKFAYAMDLTMRFIPTFGRDFQYTYDAQRARGYELENLRGGLVEQVRKMAPLIVPVTIHAIIGSEDIIDAMDLRAFGIGPRTWLIKLQYRYRDYFLIAFSVIMLVVSISLSLFGFGKFYVPQGLIESIGN
jgi:energy-coupling factor transport system permease protein